MNSIEREQFIREKIQENIKSEIDSGNATSVEITDVTPFDTFKNLLKDSNNTHLPTLLVVLMKNQRASKKFY